MILLIKQPQKIDKDSVKQNRFQGSYLHEPWKRQLKGIKNKLLYFPNGNHWVLQPQNGLVW